MDLTSNLLGNFFALRRFDKKLTFNDSTSSRLSRIQQNDMQN